MTIVDKYILRKILEVSSPQTFVSIILCSKDSYNNNIDLIPVKRKESLKLITENNTKYNILPNGKKEGLYERFHKNGIIYERYNYINNKREGLYEEFYESGSLKRRCNYINNNIEGLNTLYVNGLIYEKSIYINGKREGICEEFNSDGTVSLRCHYINDKLEDSYELFYNNGSIMEIGKFLNNEIAEILREDGSIRYY